MKGFDKYSQNGPRDNLVVSVYGREKCGKTHFSLTAPGPIAFFNLDMGLDRATAGGEFDDKELFVASFPGVGVDNVVGAPGDLTRLLTLYEKALREARTVVVDTMTQVYELVRLAKFGRLEQVPPYKYGVVNSLMSGLVKQAIDSPANVIFLSRATKEYKPKSNVKGAESEWTGDYERAGYKDLGYDCQAEIRLERKEPNKHKRAKAPEKLGFQAVVLSSGFTEEMTGETLNSEKLSFPIVASMLLPGSKPSKWLD